MPIKKIDLYHPQDGKVSEKDATLAAAIFVDHAYDGKTFCVCQALFPSRSAKAWEKLQKALKGTIEAHIFNQMQTTRSVSFVPGEKIAVKVIDDRGNEVMSILDPAKPSNFRGPDDGQ